MSYVPDFENDIFISYAHIDNQALTEAQKGWIDEFHRALEIRLQESLGNRLIKIWRDPELQGNDVFSKTLVEKFSKTAILVSVFSPSYVNSDWCQKELKGFIQAAEQNQGFVIGDKARVFKVLKTLVPRERHLPPLDSMLGYEFYEIDKATGRPKEFRHVFGEEAVKKFLAKLDDLAWEICQLLDTLRNLKGDNGKQATKPSGPSIYLAETTSDRTNERDKIKRELQQRGCTVLPDRLLPLNAADFKKAVRADLERCQFSIHLIGEKYGAVPEDATTSVACLQNELAVERGQAPAFFRLIWMPAGLQPQDERQREFINHLQNDPSMLKGAELLRRSLEELKTIIQDKLSVKQKPSAEPVGETGPVRLYLMCDQRDVEAVAPLYEHLVAQGFEVDLPAFEGDPAEVRENHEAKLRTCYAPLIYYGSAKDSWRDTNLLDCKKFASKAQLKPTIYIGPPETPLKRLYSKQEALVLKNFATFSPEVLQPFLTQIAQQKKYDDKAN